MVRILVQYLDPAYEEQIIIIIQISILILVVGFILIGLVLFAAYKVAEHKDMKRDQLRLTQPLPFQVNTSCSNHPVTYLSAMSEL
jgi:hypothetical protein